MTWSLAFQVRDGEINVVSRSTELPDMNVNLNGYESDTTSNVGISVGVIKKK